MKGICRASTLFVTCLFYGINFAEAQEPNRTYAVGIGGFATRAFADVAKTRYTPSVSVSYYNHLTEFATLSIEVQLGQIAGGDRNTDPYEREFSNAFGAVAFCADVQAGTFFSVKEVPARNTLRNFYAGAGLGVLFNSMRYIQRQNPNRFIPYAGLDRSTNFMLPLRIGYELKFANRQNETRYRVDIGYQFNVTFAEGLDGYDEPGTANNARDMFSQLGLVFKYDL